MKFMRMDPLKWLAGLGVVFMIFLGGRLWWSDRHSLIHGKLPEESYSVSASSELGSPGTGTAEGAAVNASEWEVISFGYHLVPWPKRFQGDPIVTTFDYQKGPPAKFISKLTQIWSPGNAELVIEGPRTPEAGVSVTQWKSCLQSVFCVDRKRRFVDSVLRDLQKHRPRLKKGVWFESDTLDAGRGLDLEIDLDSEILERIVLITDAGNTQNFTLRTSKNEIGEAARELFRKIRGSFMVKDDLRNPREWISTRLRGVELAKIHAISDPKVRYAKLIETQNLLFSQIAIDPRNVAPFFHLAGVTHLLGMSLLKEKKSYFKNQESWILLVQPLLSALIQYVGDFQDGGKEKGERGAALANMGSLLQDFLLLKKKLSK